MLSVVGGGIIKKHTKSERIKEFLIFDVVVNVHGKKPHIEKYKMDFKDVPFARSLGYLNGFYLDWKPIKTSTSYKDLKGGIYKVNHYTRDDKYVYAHTKEGFTFSLPKYLEKDIKTYNDKKEYILFGKRV